MPAQTCTMIYTEDSILHIVHHDKDGEWRKFIRTEMSHLITTLVSAKQITFPSSEAAHRYWSQRYGK